MLLSLTGICVVAGAVLAAVNNLTAGPIVASKAAALETAIKAVTPEFNNKPSEESYMVATPEGDSLRIYPAKMDGQFVGAAVESFSKKGFSGEIKVIVGFDTEGKLCNYSVLQHAETPGLGAEIAGEHFQGEFTGKKTIENGEIALGVVKNGKVEKADYQVDGISGGTITSVGVDAMLKNCLSNYKSFLTNNEEDKE